MTATSGTSPRKTKCTSESPSTIGNVFCFSMNSSISCFLFSASLTFRMNSPNSDPEARRARPGSAVSAFGRPSPAAFGQIQREDVLLVAQVELRIDERRQRPGDRLGHLSAVEHFQACRRDPARG